MNEITKVLLLGIIQGLTEFLPVSSSGHLVLIGKALDFSETGNMTEVILHIGTFFAVLVYFRAQLTSLVACFFNGDRDARRYVGALALGSLPVMAVYFAAGDLIESLFDEPIWAAVFLCITGLMLISLLLHRGAEKEITVGKGFLIGLAQAIALLPGISRSGSTIVLARHLGIKAERAAEFSFLLSLPAMAGAILIKIMCFLKGSESIVPAPALVGLLASALVGYATLALLFSVIKRGRLWMLGVYCLAAGILSILMLIF